MKSQIAKRSVVVAGHKTSVSLEDVSRMIKSKTPKASQADEAHIATAGYWREQRVGIDRIAKLKALRLAQEAPTEPAKPKRKKAANVARPSTTPKRRWRG